MISLPSRLLPVVLLAAIGFFCLIGRSPAAEELSPRPAWTTSKIQGTPTPPAPYRIVPAFPALKFDHPSSLQEMPGGRMLVTEMGGKFFSFPKEPGVTRADLMGDLASGLPKELAGESVRLFSAALHPEFKQNGYLFACYVFPGPDKHTRVSQFEVAGENPPKIRPESERILLRWPTGGHNGGCLAFGKDGMLYISTGDGAGPNPPDGRTTGQDISDLLGAVLRIDVNDSTDEQPYRVPPDNPFVNTPGARPEIWAYGLRNPWKFGIDEKTGAIFAADNGWESWEMIHKIVRGGNCGWPIMEGRAMLRAEVSPGPTPIRPPVKDHPHTEANSVIGGPIYRGKKLPGLDGAFIYGDYITGTIWSVQTGDGEVYQHQTLVDTDQRIVDFTEGRGGELYVLDYDYTGQIYELLPTDRKDTSADFPRRLSETGLFSSLENMTPAAGVVAYDVKVPRWMDGAIAQRFVAIPGRETVALSQGQNAASYPEGTVFVEHLSFPEAGGKTLPVETQILHYEYGQWQPYSYLWNEEGSDAELVDAIGADRVFDLPAVHPHTKPAPRTWHVNAQNECKLCHNAGSGFVLGFVPNQLDRSFGEGSGLNQLEALETLGVIAAVPSREGNAAARLVDPRDESQTLDDRARSYLHANCSMCHHPGGNAIISFYLRRELPFDKLNTNKGTGIGTFGMQDAKIIVPGDPYRSILMYRMSKLGYARMPYIGSRAVDSFGVALIEDWIRSMKLEPGRTFSLDQQAEAPESLDLIQKDSSTRRQSEHGVRMLLRSTEGGLALAGQMHRGKLNQEAQRLAVSAGKLKAVKSDIRGLFETFVPEAERRPTLGPNIDPQTVLDVAGDAARGKLIFFSDSARCRNCHDLSDREKSTGPTLLEIRKKYAKPAELLQHVLKPSLKIDEAFASYIVLTASGQVVTGLLVKEDPKSVTLNTAEKKQVTIPRDKIEALQKAEKSLMPERILSDLTAQEAADLLSYLMSLDAKP